MKLQRILVLLGVSACLFATQVQGTFGLEEKTPEQLAIEALKGQALNENALLDQTVDQTAAIIVEGSSQEALPEQTSPTESGTGETVNPPMEDNLNEESPEKIDAENSQEGSSDDIDTEKEKEQELPEKETSEETKEETENQTESNTQKVPEVHNQGNTGSTQQTSQQPVTPQVSTTNHASSAASLDWFRASGTFLDKRDKIKYNVSMPIEGLPSFITQEMVVGALKCQDETGYPASVTIAQIIQESGFGKYGPNGENGQGLSYLAFQYNNLFGIKGTGTAGSVNMATGEQTEDGTSYMTTAGFRVYNTYTECIEDRTKVLEEVYGDLTNGVADANTFAMKIGRRWATDINYARSLISQMKQYDLYRLDDMTLDDFKEMMGTFANPCPGSVVTSNFGHRTAPTQGATTFHKGIDLGTGNYNIPTYAVESGKVIFAGEAGACGNMITIDHGNGIVTKYMHHDKLYVKEGQMVEKGQQIGLSGTTGNSTGNHLHFQMELNGVAIDPTVYLGIKDGKL